MAVHKKERDRKKVQAIPSNGIKLHITNKYRKPPKEKESDPDKLTPPTKNIENSEKISPSVDELNRLLAGRRVACLSRTMKYCVTSKKSWKNKYLLKKQCKKHEKG